LFYQDLEPHRFKEEQMHIGPNGSSNGEAETTMVAKRRGRPPKIRPQEAPTQPPSDLVVVRDQTEIALLAAYVIMAHGQAHIALIMDTFKSRLGASVHQASLKSALTALQKRDMVAVNQVQLDTGTMVNTYSLKKVPQAAVPPVMHVKELLPKLLATPELDGLRKSLSGQVKESGNKYLGHTMYRARVVNLDPLLGSQIGCMLSDMVREKFPNDFDRAINQSKKSDEEATVLSGSGRYADMGIWERDPLNGDYILQADVLRGWFKTNVIYRAELAKATAQYISFQPVRFSYATTKVAELVLPVNPADGKPSAPKKYEAILPGTEFELVWSAPVAGFLTPTEMERMMILACMQPVRGLSPARGSRYGHLAILSFETLNTLRNGDFSAAIPNEVKARASAYLTDASARLANIEWTERKADKDK
jgi:hypothetical protein